MHIQQLMHGTSVDSFGHVVEVLPFCKFIANYGFQFKKNLVVSDGTFSTIECDLYGNHALNNIQKTDLIALTTMKVSSCNNLNSLVTFFVNQIVSES